MKILLNESRFSAHYPDLSDEPKLKSIAALR